MDEQELGEASLTKATMLESSAIVFAVTSKKNEKDLVQYELFSEPPISEALREKAAAHISFFLSLEDDLNPFYQIAESDSKFHSVVKNLWGFHHVKFPSLLEAAIWAILSQRAPIPIAHKMKRRLIQRFGSSLMVNGREYWAFPDYSRLKNVTLPTLLEVVKNKRKAEYLSWFLSSYSDLDQDFLKNAAYDRAEETLEQIPGIGEWSASFILSRGLGRMEKLSSYTKVILERMSKVYGPDGDIEEVKRRYGVWIGYWVLYLWAFRLEQLK